MDPGGLPSGGVVFGTGAWIPPCLALPGRRYDGLEALPGSLGEYGHEGERHSVSSKLDSIGVRLKRRPGPVGEGSGRRPRLYFDFLVNGRPLWRELGLRDLDLVGRFSPDTPGESRRAAGVFLLEEPPDTGTGRVMMYVCPECGDLACGAVTVIVGRDPEAGTYTWRDFGYENGYDPSLPDLFEYAGVGPYTFCDTEYRTAMESACRP